MTTSTKTAAKSAAPAQRTLVGVVEKVQYTQGGAGNQWTTIDGVRYATFWDIRTRNWKEGDKVQFVATKQALWHGQPRVDYAHSISKVKA